MCVATPALRSVLAGCGAHGASIPCRERQRHWQPLKGSLFARFPARRAMSCVHVLDDQALSGRLTVDRHGSRPVCRSFSRSDTARGRQRRSFAGATADAAARSMGRRGDQSRVTHPMPPRKTRVFWVTPLMYILRYDESGACAKSVSDRLGY